MKNSRGAWHARGDRLVDWRRLSIRCTLAAFAILAVGLVSARAQAGNYGSDFHGGIWRAGHDVLAGRSPYARADARVLLALRSAFIPPPLSAVLAVPLALLPFGVAIVLWSALCTAAFVCALLLTGARDRRFLLVAVCSYPFVASLLFGQPDGLFALALAVAWRYRADRRGAVAVGVLVAAKLLAWPLVIWLVATKRSKQAALATATCGCLLLASWAAIEFKGLAGYPALLAADARAFAGSSYSLAAELMRIGASLSGAEVAAFTAGAAFVALVVALGRRNDLACFGAAVAFGLLASPLVEVCYVAPAFVLLAIARARVRGVVLFGAPFWITPPGVLPASMQWVQVAVVLGLLMSVALFVARSGLEPADVSVRELTRRADRAENRNPSAVVVEHATAGLL